MKKNYIRAEELPEGETVYLKKDFLGWRVVDPIYNDDGSVNKMKVIFGGKRNIFILIVLLVIAFGLYIGVRELVDSYKTIAENPCAFCPDSAHFVNRSRFCSTGDCAKNIFGNVNLTTNLQLPNRGGDTMNG